MDEKQLLETVKDASSPYFRRRAASEDEILECVSFAEVQLPNDYLQFLREVGYAIFASTCVCGHHPVDDPNRAVFNADVRVLNEGFKTAFGGYYPDAVACSEDNAGGYFVFRFRNDIFEKMEWIVREGDVLSIKQWNSFKEFLEDLLRGGP